ncbi:MAG: polyphosphate kinase 1 [Flavobacteriales bacterium]|nr:polyphosphate kinase 1 [Flavobacteriales bacterium]
MQKTKVKLIERDISWLSFNERVLQEAANQSVPLLERLRFIGIFSSNRDEFFRVRMANLKRIIALGKKGKDLIEGNPEKILKEVQKIVFNQQKIFDKVYESLINDIKKEGIVFLNENELTPAHQKFIKEYFHDIVRPTLVPIMLGKKDKFPQLRDKSIYLAIKLYNKTADQNIRFAIMEIPSRIISRHIQLPSPAGTTNVIMLDDIIRFNLHDIFSIFRFENIEAYCIKLTRDAELDINEYDFSKSAPEKLAKSLKSRKSGSLVRFIYDKNMPEDLLHFLITKLKLKIDDNLIPGARYHNFKDFISFPNIGNPSLSYRPFTPLTVKKLEIKTSLLDVIKKQDILLSYPYQSFNYIIDILREAAIDPKVYSIKINLYRVAKQSKIINALINAAKNGKAVTVVIELKARFDEEANLHWAELLQEEGIRVINGVPHLKVHSKLIIISKTEGKKVTRYAHIGTGNFNEETSKLYCDYSLFTANQKIANEVNKVFDFFKNNTERGNFSYLLVSPFNMRRKLYSLIDNEIENAQRGKIASITLKLNNLSDKEIIKKLYEASASGVKVNLIIRSICSINPRVKGMSENINAISIVDRFLEHARVMIFANAGKNLVFISSADWMSRNLDSRLEVATPILDADIKDSLIKQMNIQLTDNTKARLLNDKVVNQFYQPKKQDQLINAQTEIYRFLKKEE